MSKTFTGVEKVLKIFSDIDQYQWEVFNQSEVEVRGLRGKHFPNLYSRITIGAFSGAFSLAVVFGVILWIYGSKYQPLEYLRVPIQIFLFITYVMLILFLIIAIRRRRDTSLRAQFLGEPTRNPFETLLRNVEFTAKADFHHMSELMKIDIYDLENVLLEVRAARESYERRMSLVVGAIDKVGILPSLLVLPSIFKNIDNWNWLNVSALFLVMFYVQFYALAVSGHYLSMRLDRMAKLLELCIQRKKAEGGSPEAL